MALKLIIGGTIVCMATLALMLTVFVFSAVFTSGPPPYWIMLPAPFGVLSIVVGMIIQFIQFMFTEDL